MATAQLITKDNFDDPLLAESSDSASGTPDSNFCFDETNKVFELISLDELANADLGSGAEANPLSANLGITFQAVYAFERQRRRLNNSLRILRPGGEHKFQRAGAWELANGWKLRTADYPKVRQTGLVCRGVDDSIEEIYFGVKSLNFIDPASQPYGQFLPGDYYELTEAQQIAARQAAATFDFARPGPVDEMVKVFGDASHGNFDYTGNILLIGVRTWGNVFGETDSNKANIQELHGFSAAFGIGEGPNDDNNYTLADVFGGSAIAPWSTMDYEHFDTPVTKTGFTGSATGDFSDILDNPAAGSLLQVLAYCDALMLQETDQDSGAGSFIPKRADLLYTRANGLIYFRKGFFVDLPEADKQKVVFLDDDDTTLTYPFNVDVRIRVSDAWANDANAWGQAMYKDGAGAADFGTSGAVIVNDAAGSPVVFTSADVVGSAGSYEIRFTYAYDSNTQAGLNAGEDKAIIALCEGDGGASMGEADFTITRQAIVNADASAPAETAFG